MNTNKLSGEAILQIMQEKGESWMIAAMMEGSIGYHTPSSAKRAIEAMKNGETQDASERCMACFRGDLLYMISYDIACMKMLEEADPESARRLFDFVDRLGTFSDVDQMTVGLMYPTI